MKQNFTIPLSIAAVLLGAPVVFAQTPPGGTPVPLSEAATAVTPRSGSGPVSPDTGYSATGRGGVGGIGGGPTTAGTASGAGTFTGGNPSGYPDRN